MAADPFAVELGRALTGEELTLTDASVDGVTAELAALGWGAARLADLRHRRQAEEQPWPFEVRRDAVATVGFAVFHARLAKLREHLGLTGLNPTPRTVRAWTPDERRLAADRPPHWG